jgi:hypothetical protein
MVCNVSEKDKRMITEHFSDEVKAYKCIKEIELFGNATKRNFFIKADILYIVKSDIGFFAYNQNREQLFIFKDMLEMREILQYFLEEK